MAVKRDEARARGIRDRGLEINKHLGGKAGESNAWGDGFGRRAEEDDQGSSL